MKLILTCISLLCLGVCSSSSGRVTPGQNIVACTMDDNQKSGPIAEGYFCRTSHGRPGQVAPIQDADCRTDEDCLPGRLCQPRTIGRELSCSGRVANTIGKLWFVTDPIRPGVSSSCSNPDGGCAEGSAYAYNIMAKGGGSLRDWCMTQAQQSLDPEIRKVIAWVPLLQTSVSEESSAITLMTNAANGGARGPLQAEPYSNLNKNLYSKNGDFVVGVGGPSQNYPFVGFSRTFYYGATSGDCKRSSGEDCSDGWYADGCNGFGRGCHWRNDVVEDDCGFLSNSCTCHAFPVPGLDRDVDYQTAAPHTNPLRLWANSSNTWAGIFVPNPESYNGSNNCDPNTFLLWKDGGGFVNYDANGTTQRGVICLAQ